MTIDQLLKQYQKPHAEDLFSPTVIDLFCGCGGLSLGFKRAGYQVLIYQDVLDERDAGSAASTWIESTDGLTVTYKCN